jgi:hypothetical protein
MRWRDVLEKVLAIGGVVVVLVPVVTLADDVWQIVVVVVGLLFIEAGVWNLAGRLPPEDRKYTRLRHEVEAFLEDVRVLNGHAVQGDDEAVDADRARLRERVDAMVDAAGKEEP